MGRTLRQNLARLGEKNLREVEVRNTMPIRIAIAATLVAIVAFFSAYTVETGNVAVERTLGKVDHEEKARA